MNYGELGKTGIRVSRLCFGTLTMGPLQASLSIGEGAELIRMAVDLGVTFFDTAELYGTYPYLAEGLRGLEEQTVVASKSYAYEREDMARDLEKALRETGRGHIDIFLLHEQESALTLRGHRAALDYLLQARDKGLVRAVGISTHAVEAVEAATLLEEIDVIHPLLNYRGLGIKGTLEGMLAAVRDAYLAGKGIYAMKAFGGGNLLGQIDQAAAFIRQVPWVHSIAVGIKTPEELLMDLLLLSGEEVPEYLRTRVRGQKKRLLVEEWCSGCGRCLAACRTGALVLEGGRVRVQEERCLLCGYCSYFCPEFVIKIF
ncbi:MAG: aldo/keto reductase [Firmicutes bacterium]|nr:aldo/keto reductase [Bacillota bacterium]MCL5040351.1 aldo/keto reductase [Bacillota bacterium]